MKKITLILAAVLIILSIMATAVFANSANPPSWRGDAGSTFQEWTFTNDYNDTNIAPDSGYINSYGIPSLSIVLGGEFAEGYIEGDFMPPETGVWDLGINGTMNISIPNSSNTSADSYKLIKVQVTYFDSSPLYAPSVFINHNALLLDSGTTWVSNEQGFPGDWMSYWSEWQITPNPTNEEITIMSSTSGSLIDQVVVDTKCVGTTVVPEPSSILALIAGIPGLLLLKRRKI